MQGYVLAYRPATGDGAILADSGHTFRFTLSSSQVDLRGGDIVSFEPMRETALSSECEIRLLSRAAPRVAFEEAASLFSTVEMISVSGFAHSIAQN
jgi:hypothetical protein